MNLLDPFYGQLAAAQASGNQQYQAFQQHPWQAWTVEPEMQALLHRQAVERMQLQAKLQARSEEAMRWYAECAARARDADLIANAPDLWRRLDAARQRRGLP